MFHCAIVGGCVLAGKPTGTYDEKYAPRNSITCFDFIQMVIEHVGIEINS